MRNDDYWRTEPAWEGGPTGPAKLQRVVIKIVDEMGHPLCHAAGWRCRFATGRLARPTAQVDPLVGEQCEYDSRAGDL